mmetsp:Transcript_45499/g.145158  ORF Transcript_45499/g.145158 Transcript_45499/m.145158 type:complete len:116 (+) Transcript_45499:176-523(+)
MDTQAYSVSVRLEHGGGRFVQPDLHSPKRYTELGKLTNTNEYWGYTRAFDSSLLVEGLSFALNSTDSQGSPHLSHRFRDWALDSGHPLACGGKAIQLVDSGRPADEREFGKPASS